MKASELPENVPVLVYCTPGNGQVSVMMLSEGKLFNVKPDGARGRQCQSRHPELFTVLHTPPNEFLFNSPPEKES